MKRTMILGLLCLQFFCACNNTDGVKDETSSENDVDAARNFIRSALDGKWSEARKFMVQDSVNSQILDTYEERYETRMNREEKRGYHEANITSYDPRRVNDSVIIFNYSNTYKKQRDSLKLVRINGQWLIDLKYSYFPLNATKNVQ